MAHVSCPVTEFNYIVIEGPHYKLISKALTEKGASCASVGWLKQCVLMGSLQPLWVGEKDAMICTDNS